MDSRIYKNILILFFSAIIITGCASLQAVRTQQRIIFFGDSITQQGIGPNGYVTQISDSLRVLGCGDEVIGAGISGNKVTDLQARLEKDVIEKKPTVVVIYIGINDVWHWSMAHKGLKGTPAEVYQNGLQQMIGRIQETGARVILCTPSVIGEKPDGTNAQDAMLDGYSVLSRTVAAAARTPVCDLRKKFLQYENEHNSAMKESGILTTDRVHLNARGNRFVADEILAVLFAENMLSPCAAAGK